MNQNFTDIINSLTDGTKSLSIDALTAAGTATFNGAVTLGNGTPDDITFTGSLASSINIKTNNSFDFGSSTLGLASVYLGSPSSRTTRLRSHQSLGSSFTFILPNGGGTDGYFMQTDGSGNTSWQPVGGPELASNYSLTTSVAASAMTIALKDAGGSDPSSTSPVRINFRSATAATGTVTQRSVTAALSVTITSGASLGLADGKDGYIYVYAIDNAGTVELAVSGDSIFDQGSRQSTTALSSGSDSTNVLYATSNRTNVAIRYLGRILSNQTTAGTYSNNASEVSSQNVVLIPRKVYAQYTSTSTSSVSTATPVTYGTKVFDSDNAFSGTVFTAPRADTYILNASFYVSSASYTPRLYKNGSFLCQGTLGTLSSMAEINNQIFLNAGETLEIRADNTYTLANNATLSWFQISSQSGV